MNASRRDFLKLTALGGSALALGFHSRLFAADDAPSPFQPNVWIRIDPDNRVTLTAGKTEMGQGVRTSLAMILAEELDADWGRVEVIQGIPGPQLPSLGTGGSWSVRALWQPLRTAGAAAREMLVAAAAARLGVEPATLRTEKSFVIHDASNRRLSYGELTADAAKLTLPKEPKLKDAARFRLVGKPTKRIDGREIVTGRAVYGLDARPKNLLYASLERPPVIGGSVKSFDATKALKVPGVVKVAQVTRGIAVIARDSWSALEGRKALDVVFDDNGLGSFDSRAWRQSLEEAAVQPGIVTRKEGDGAAALGSPVKLLEADYRYPFYAHAPVETMNTTAWVHDGVCEIWSPTQAPNQVHEQCAKRLELDPSKVTVHTTLIGGGFGRRLDWDYALDAVDVARLVDRPVQLFWTRADDMRHGYFQAASVHRMKAVLDAEGKPVYWAHKKVSTYHNARGRKVTDAQASDPEFNRGSSWGVYDVPYAIPAIDTAYVYVKTHVPIGPWRAVFAPSSVFAAETFIDEIAAAAGRDPLQLRLDLLTGVPDIVEAGNLKISRNRLRRVLETARDKSKWGEPLPKGRGRGIACNVYHGETHVAYVVDVTVDPKKNVRVDNVVCVIDCGLVVNPIGVEQQVEGGVVWGLSSALKGEITIKNGVVEQSTFNDFGVLRMNECPPIQTHILTGDRPVPVGVGEPTVAPIVPALVNAVYAATGKRVRDLPIRL